jgi:uncharacterized Zn-finger protein
MSKKKKQVILVNSKDLPIFCPPSNSSAWAMHPKVFLDHHGKTQVSCPYCGAEFKIT